MNISSSVAYLTGLEEAAELINWKCPLENYDEFTPEEYAAQIAYNYAVNDARLQSSPEIMDEVENIFNMLEDYSAKFDREEARNIVMQEVI